ncbi:MAG: helix-turn-helix transcriptional regulator [Gemmatimonadota bacterium]
MAGLITTGDTDREVLRTIGKRLATLREAHDLTAVSASRAAGVSRGTLQRAEAGENSTLLTLVRLLRVYGRLGALETFIPEPEISPLKLLRESRSAYDG